MSDDLINWVKIKEKSYKAGYRNMVNKTFQLPAGNITDFDIVESGLIVSILPITIDNYVLLTRQYRPGQERILIELPGGGMKEEEIPDQAAHRELIEETGYTGKLQFVCTSLHSAYDTAVRYNFVALQCTKLQEPKMEDNNEPSEIVLYSLRDFRKHLFSGEITDVATGYLGLDYLKLL